MGNWLPSDSRLPPRSARSGVRHAGGVCRWRRWGGSLESRFAAEFGDRFPGRVSRARLSTSLEIHRPKEPPGRSPAQGRHGACPAVAADSRPRCAVRSGGPEQKSRGRTRGDGSGTRRLLHRERQAGGIGIGPRDPAFRCQGLAVFLRQRGSDPAHRAPGRRFPDREVSAGSAGELEADGHRIVALDGADIAGGGPRRAFQVGVQDRDFCGCGRPCSASRRA